MPALGSVIAKAVVRGSKDILDFDEVQKAISGRLEDTLLTGEKPISSAQISYMAQVAQDATAGKIRDPDLGIPDAEEIKGNIEGILDMHGITRAAEKYRFNNVPETKSVDEADEVVVNMIEDYMAVQPKSELVSRQHKRFLAEQIVLGMRDGKFLESILPKGARDLKFPTKGNDLDIMVDRTIRKADDAAGESDFNLERQEALEKFIENSAVTHPVYRSISFNPEYDWDSRFAMRNEVAPHYGTEGQANYIALSAVTGKKPEEFLEVSSEIFSPDGGKYLYKSELEKIYDIHNKARSLGWNPDRYNPDEPTLLQLVQDGKLPEAESRPILEALLNMKSSDQPPTIFKGYLSIKNPLDLDDGTWTVDDMFHASPVNTKKDSKSVMMDIVYAIAGQTGKDAVDIIRSPKFQELRESVDKTRDFVDFLSEDIDPFDREFNQFDMVGQIYLDLQRASVNERFVDFIESYGFDGIRYINQIEPTYFEETADAYSYIPFRPEQFKTFGALRFDEADPRMFAATGGSVTRRFVMAKGGKVDKKKMKCNKPKRTPNHPKKSHVVKACKDGKEKIIRF
ncbi:MAG: hypothetical protein CL833_02045, partial [Crocinitomicaceae bacterium]|nr:hypothetical protein [Crocinitomicaceae bacterium]